MRTIRKGEVCEFRFGNAGTIVSRETVLLPACVGNRKFLIKASVLPEGGKWTPLLLSKEFMKQLGTVLDTEHDMVEFRRLGVKVELRISERGHYVVPLFDFSNQCLTAEITKDRKIGERRFAISELEREEFSNSEDHHPIRDPAAPDSSDVQWQPHVSGGQRDPADDEQSGERRPDDPGQASYQEGPGSVSGRASGWSWMPSSRRMPHEGREVWQERHDEDPGGGVHDRQELHQLGSRAHQRTELASPPTVEDLRAPSRCQKERTNPETGALVVTVNTASQDEGSDMHAARNMPKVVKARKQPETEENEMEWCTENAEWEQIQDHQGQMIEAWKHLVSQKMVMKQEQIMITTQRIVDGNVGTERLAKFLVQMTQA